MSAAITDGFRESPHRPWPADSRRFLIVDVSPHWLDLCFLRESDGATVYLASKPKDPNRK